MNIAILNNSCTQYFILHILYMHVYVLNNPNNILYKQNGNEMEYHNIGQTVRRLHLIIRKYIRAQSRLYYDGGMKVTEVKRARAAVYRLAVRLPSNCADVLSDLKYRELYKSFYGECISYSFENCYIFAIISVY